MPLAQKWMVKFVLFTPLHSGQVVEITHRRISNTESRLAQFLLIPKKHAALQNLLREQDIDEQRLVGQQALNRALKLFHRLIDDLSAEDWISVLEWRHLANRYAI